jgi:methylated-DNA-[protein]-cysteine S-methyltransferase
MLGFRSRVLRLVMKIPRGKVTTYKEIAVALGRPHAWRAVANVLAKNPRPMEIPCHRVVRSDGKIGGYKFGIQRKERLLREEGVEVRDKKVDIKKYMFHF